MIYLDYNATAPMKPAVREAMVEAMDRTGNPSSVHRFGRTAKRYVEEARARVAALVGVDPVQVVFTGCGTEANNFALHRDDVKSFIVSSIEHDSVLATAKNAKLIPITSDGVIDLQATQKLIDEAPVPSLIAVMYVNNETGVIQPVAELVRMAKRKGHFVHTDAVQAAGRLPLDFNALGADTMTVSAHKLGGPQGVGALIIRDGVTLPPLLQGGGQERRRRSGTENVPGIIGFGVAAQLAADDLREASRLSHWRDLLQKSLCAIAGDHAVVVGGKVPRVCNTLCIAMRGVPSETQVVAMDLAGVAVSAGSACSSGKVKASHVLMSMGLGEDIAGSALRLSMGWNTQIEDIERCVKAWTALYHRTHQQDLSQSAA